jgi:DNA-binding NtrC family response regulator
VPRRPSLAVPDEDDFTPRPLREIEIDYIRQTLEHFGGNKSRAAKSLGISRQTLRDKLVAADRDDLDESPPTRRGQISVGSTSS